VEYSRAPNADRLTEALVELAARRIVTVGHYRFLVFTNPIDGMDVEYNQWYDAVHLGEVIAVPGFIAAERYRCCPTAEAALDHAYLAIYEFEADDPVATLAELTARARDGRIDMTPVLAPDIETRLYEVITPRISR
jgi:hypothetical protein